MMIMAATAPIVDLDAIIGPGGLVVLAPHPDDESLGCGALLRAAACAGRCVVVVVVTDGRRSHLSSPSVDADTLARLRSLEVRAALTELHRDITLIELGYHDCAAPERLPAAGVAVEIIVGAVDKAAATALITTWAGDPHRDHAASAALADLVHVCRPELRLWSYPIWGRFLSGEMDSPRRIVRFDTRPHRAAKIAAIACHRTQMTRIIDDDPDGFMMSPEMQTHFIDHPEVFLAD